MFSFKGLHGVCSLSSLQMVSSEPVRDVGRYAGVRKLPARLFLLSRYDSVQNGLARGGSRSGWRPCLQAIPRTSSGQLSQLKSFRACISPTAVFSGPAELGLVA
jgi:hypothetical protein